MLMLAFQKTPVRRKRKACFKSVWRYHKQAWSLSKVRFLLFLVHRNDELCHYGNQQARPFSLSLSRSLPLPLALCLSPHSSAVLVLFTGETHFLKGVRDVCRIIPPSTVGEVDTLSDSCQQISTRNVKLGMEVSWRVVSQFHEGRWCRDRYLRWCHWRHCDPWSRYIRQPPPQGLRHPLQVQPMIPRHCLDPLPPGFWSSCFPSTNQPSAPGRTEHFRGKGRST